MQLDIKILSEYRLDRAKEDLEAARGNNQLEQILLRYLSCNQSSEYLGWL